VALAVKGRQPVVASSGEVGRLRFLRTGADSVGPDLVEAILVDDQHRKDALVSPGIPVKSAGSYRPAVPLPVRFALHTARPNPMRVGTVVTFDIPNPGAEVKIKIYDVGGRVVRTILDTYRPPGYYSESWDLKNTRGRRVAPGIYFCRMEAGKFKDVKKMVLLR